VKQNETSLLNDYGSKGLRFESSRVRHSFTGDAEVSRPFISMEGGGGLTELLLCKMTGGMLGVLQVGKKASLGVTVRKQDAA
jgi:hypothetical protein